MYGSLLTSGMHTSERIVCQLPRDLIWRAQGSRCSVKTQPGDNCAYFQNIWFFAHSSWFFALTPKKVSATNFLYMIFLLGFIFNLWLVEVFNHALCIYSYSFHPIDLKYSHNASYCMICSMSFLYLLYSNWKKSP